MTKPQSAIFPQEPFASPPSELREPDSAPDAPRAGNEYQLDGESKETDPDTWYGLVWRIVSTALESNTKLVRVSILLILVCVALWLIARVGR
jgi:hypothetical protein